MFSHCLPRIEILRIFILASDTQKPDLYLLLEVFYQPLWIGAVVHLRNEEAVGSLHVTQILRETRSFKSTKYTSFVILPKHIGFFWFGWLNIRIEG